MLFSSIPFLYAFLPLTATLYFAAPKKLKNGVLLLFSLVFYGWGEPKYLLLMLFSITQGYIFGLLIERTRESRRSKVFLTASVFVSLLLLGYCKYVDFFIGSFNSITGLSVPLLKVALPIGISFYTFQILSYTIDVYRGDVPAQRNYVNLALYIAMFPQLIAGPIVRYSDIVPQLENRTHSIENAAYGIRRFTVGLSKKILIANVLAELVSGFKGSGEQSVLYYWLYAAACTLQIYFDFSGYSDMAIGIGRIFGFRFSENFDYPYISGSITEFWRRWHISLGSWFRDYLYIPLGGNRVGKLRWFFNIFVVWFATGIWHGAAWNFVLWGLMYAVLLVNEKLWLLKPLKKSRVLNHVYTMFFVVIGFVLFDAESVGSAFSALGAMFGFGGLPVVSSEALYALKSFAVVLIVAVLGATPMFQKLFRRFERTKAGSAVLTVAEPLGIVLLLTVCTAYLVDGSFNPFLYFRF